MNRARHLEVAPEPRPWATPALTGLHSTEFGLHVWRDGGDVRIELSGALRRSRVPELEDALAAAEAGDAECVVLDLRRLVLIAGSGVEVIVTAHDRLTGGRALLLLRGPCSVQRRFERAGVDGWLFFLD